MRRAAFLDRDGVINRSMIRNGRPYAPTDIADLEILPGVPVALQRLRSAGFLTIVVTNQPDLKTGKQTRRGVDSMHAKLKHELALDAFFICGHTDVDACECRKPKAGLLFEAAAAWDIDLHASWLVGDRWRDIAAGQAAGCRCCFIDHGYDERRPTLPYRSVTSLADAVDAILAGDSFKNEGKGR